MAVLEAILMTAMGIQAMDMAMFPAVLKVLEEYLPGASPAPLGVVMMFQAICHCSLLPFWGYWADRTDRVLMLSNIALAMGAVTMCMGFVTSLGGLCACRAFSGAFSGAMHPCAQGIVATKVPPHRRGLVFGYTVSAPAVGGLLGMVYAGAMSHVEVFEHQGWRLAFISFGFTTILAGIGLHYARLKSTAVMQLGEMSGAPSDTSPFQDFLIIARTRSFILVILQGIFASTARSAMTYLVMLFQYMQYSDFRASTLAGMGDVGQAVGALVAGTLSDSIARKSPLHGRVLLGQAGSLGCICMLTTIVGTIHGGGLLDNKHFSFLASSMFSLGILSVTAYVGSIKPILVEIVPLRLSGSILAYAAAIDGAVAAFIGAPLVGAVSENVFGYVSTDDTISEMPDAVRETNMLALAKAFIAVFGFSTVMSFVIFSLLHATFPGDRRLEEDMLTGSVAQKPQVRSTEGSSGGQSSIVNEQSALLCGNGQMPPPPG